MLPVVVGIIRGALLAGATAALGFLITAVSAVDLGDLAVWAPVGVAALRAAEAWLLDRRQPRQQAPLGGGPAE